MDLLLDEGSDLVLRDGDLVLDTGLATSIAVSIFSDARLSPEESPDGSVRGWWAEDAGDEFGSTLWRHARAKATQTEIPAIVQAVEASLAWLLEDGIASAVEVSATIVDADRLSLEVELIRGTATLFSSVWESMKDFQETRGSTALQVVLS